MIHKYIYFFYFILLLLLLMFFILLILLLFITFLCLCVITPMWLGMHFELLEVLERGAFVYGHTPKGTLSSPHFYRHAATKEFTFECRTCG